MNMNKYERLNQQKKYRSEKSFSGKKRVAAYCRVSTEKEEQAQSFESQCDFFRCYIEQKEEWEFYKVFADEGISGTSTKKREQFNQMIAEAKQRKFDLLITKEISRFARNTLDSIYYTRELRKVGVGIYLKALKALGLTADKAIAVEDSPTGIASAKAAGLKVLALKPRHGEPLDQSAADCIITRLMDVKEHLD